jgi:hypothetical protein
LPERNLRPLLSWPGSASIDDLNALRAYQVIRG